MFPFVQVVRPSLSKPHADVRTLTLSMGRWQVREIALNMAPADVPAFRWQATALQALQAAAEAYLVHMFEQG